MKNTDSRAKILVIGAAGNFGAAITPALVAAGHEVRALRRAGGRPIEVPGVEVIEGDALEVEDVRRAARGVDVIVHAFNAPYPDWDPKIFEAARVTCEVAAAEQALIVLPGNVYGLDPGDGAPMREDAAKDAPCHKGALRNRLEAQLTEATERGARLLILRAGDYFGPGATLTWFHEMTKKLASGGALSDPGSDGVLHDWAYLPDVADAAVRLIDRRDELESAQTFHFSSGHLTSRQMLDAINEVLERPRPIRAMPWWLLRPIQVFSPMLRELFDVRYLWQRPVLLDDGALERWLGGLRRTPLQDALREAVGAELCRARRAA